jgi:two-component sensor histidine kinase
MTEGADREGNGSALRLGGEIGRGLVHALRNAGITVFYQSPELRVIWARNVPDSWGGMAIIDKTDAEFLPGAAAARIVERKNTVLRSGQPDMLEFNDAGVGGGRWYDMWIDADLAEDGSVKGVVTTIVEITDRKHREQTLRTLLREVSHRSKNLLAIIQSIATQTGRYSSTIDSFLQRFRGRLQSLASSQDLVTSSNWRGAMLSALIKDQITRYRGDSDDGVRFEGVDVYLNPNAALHIGLALHELVVNSMSHGALSRPNGQVTLTSVLNKGELDGAMTLVLVWNERTNSDHGLGEKRFGSIALERVVPLSLDGKASFDLNEDRLNYRLEIPGFNFETE